jgi:hypothetical protein
MCKDNSMFFRRHLQNFIKELFLENDCAFEWKSPRGSISDAPPILTYVYKCLVINVSYW